MDQATTQAVAEQWTWASLLIGAAGGIGGAFVAGLFTHLSDRLVSASDARRDATFELFKELHSAEMLDARFDAVVLIEANASKNIREIYNACGAKREFLPVSKVFHFFEKVAALESHSRIDGDLARGLIGYYVRWWHNKTFSQLSRNLVDAEFSGWMREFDRINTRLGSDVHAPGLTN